MTDREYACGLKLSANGKVINTNTIFLYYSSAILAHTVWISIILQTEEEEVSNCILFAFIIITFSIPDCYKFFCKFQVTRKYNSFSNCKIVINSSSQNEVCEINQQVPPIFEVSLPLHSKRQEVAFDYLEI